MVTLNNKDDVLALLIHLGYLGYDFEHECVFIPNNEIKEAFAKALKDTREHTCVIEDY